MLTLTSLLLAPLALPMLQDGAKPVEATGSAQDASAPVKLPSSKGAADQALKAADEFIESVGIDKESPRWKINLPMPPKFEFSEGVDYLWHLGTNKGVITVRLMPDVAPMHVSSTIYLTRAGFYDNILFHRVIPGFMAQGGCPIGRGTGSPGYKYDGEFDDKVKHNRPGLLSMANAGPGTDGSQFFLTFVPTPHLDGRHTIFGEIIEGMDTMKKLEAQGTSPRGTTKEKLMIESATISIARQAGKQDAGAKAEGEKTRGEGK